MTPSPTGRERIAELRAIWAPGHVVPVNIDTMSRALQAIRELADIAEKAEAELAEAKKARCVCEYASKKLLANSWICQLHGEVDRNNPQNNRTRGHKKHHAKLSHEETCHKENLRIAQQSYKVLEAKLKQYEAVVEAAKNLLVFKDLTSEDLKICSSCNYSFSNPDHPRMCWTGLLIEALIALESTKEER